MSGLANLVNNALYAVNSVAEGERKGKVSVQVSQPVNGSIDFSIHDNGCGISNEDINQIFEPFYTTKENGTGLGLAVVKAIANAHDGELWLERSNESATIFRMRIPTQIQSLRNNSLKNKEQL